MEARDRVRSCEDHDSHRWYRVIGSIMCMLRRRPRTVRIPSHSYPCRRPGWVLVFAIAVCVAMSCGGRSRAAEPGPEQAMASLSFLFGANALRHGLAAIVVSESAISVEVDRLAALICSKDADPANREQALIIAEGNITLSRVRAARAAVLEQMSGVGAAPVPDALKSPTRLRVTTGSYLGQLVRLERYERRAFSRRKRAMRAIFHSEGGPFSRT